MSNSSVVINRPRSQCLVSLTWKIQQMYSWSGSSGYLPPNGDLGIQVLFSPNSCVIPWDIRIPSHLLKHLYQLANEWRGRKFEAPGLGGGASLLLPLHWLGTGHIDWPRCKGLGKCSSAICQGGKEVVWGPHSIKWFCHTQAVLFRTNEHNLKLFFHKINGKSFEGGVGGKERKLAEVPELGLEASGPYKPRTYLRKKSTQKGELSNGGRVGLDRCLRHCHKKAKKATELWLSRLCKRGVSSSAAPLDCPTRGTQLASLQTPPWERKIPGSIIWNPGSIWNQTQALEFSAT